MKKSLIKSALVGALIVFVWGMFSWMVLPWHIMSMHKFANEEKVAQAISESAPCSGIYVLPNMHCHKKEEAKEKAEIQKGPKGPFVFASVHKEGMNFNSPTPYLGWLIILIISAYLIAWLLSQTKGLKYAKRVAFVALVGLVCGMLSYLSNWVWYSFSCSYVLVNMLDLILGWGLAGLAMAKFSKR